MNLLKKQRDAVGLSIYSDTYEYYSPEKGSDRHHRMILNKLEGVLENNNQTKKTTKSLSDFVVFYLVSIYFILFLN